VYKKRLRQHKTFFFLFFFQMTWKMSWCDIQQSRKDVDVASRIVNELPSL
jgi:hypothetical protein